VKWVPQRILGDCTGEAGCLAFRQVGVSLPLFGVPLQKMRQGLPQIISGLRRHLGY